MFSDLFFKENRYINWAECQNFQKKTGGLVRKVIFRMYWNHYVETGRRACDLLLVKAAARSAFQLLGLTLNISCHFRAQVAPKFCLIDKYFPYSISQTNSPYNLRLLCLLSHLSKSKSNFKQDGNKKRVRVRKTVSCTVRPFYVVNLAWWCCSLLYPKSQGVTQKAFRKAWFYRWLSSVFFL